MKLLVIFALSAAAVFAAEPRIVYTKSFPGSVPAYVEISIAKSGETVYKEAPDDNNPITIHLADADAENIFALTDKLDRFSRPLEAPLKVAFMGTKTFRYEDGLHPPVETRFNYSADPNAQALLDWFERIAETERGFIELERTVKYDKLGVQNALILIESTRDQKRLVFPQQFLPLLDRVVKNESYLHMARERAAVFAEEIRALDQPPAAK